MKRVFYVLICSGSLLVQVGATQNRSIELAISQPVSFSSINVDKVAAIIEDCRTEEDVHRLLMQSDMWRDGVSKEKILKLIFQDDNHMVARENLTLIANSIVSLFRDDFNTFSLVSSVIEYIHDDDVENELLWRLEKNESVKDIDFSSVADIWNGSSNDILLGKLADKIVAYMEENPDKLSEEAQIQIISIIAGHISQNLLGVIDRVVEGYFLSEVQKMCDAGFGGSNYDRYVYLIRLKNRMWWNIFAGVDCYPEHGRQNNMRSRFEWVKSNRSIDSERLANDRFINSVLNFVENNYKAHPGNPYFFHLFRVVFPNIMRRIPVDQMPRAMYLQWNFNKNMTLNRIEDDMPHETWNDIFNGGLLCTLSQAEADALVDGDGEKKAFFTSAEVRRFINYTTFPKDSLRTLLQERRIDFGRNIPFLQFNLDGLDESLRKFLADYTLTFYDGLFNTESASCIIKYVPSNRLHNFINTKIDFSEADLDQVLPKLQSGNEHDANRMEIIKASWEEKRRGLENQQ